LGIGQADVSGYSPAALPMPSRGPQVDPDALTVIAWLRLQV
jgi:hypothetical protein